MNRIDEVRTKLTALKASAAGNSGVDTLIVIISLLVDEVEDLAKKVKPK